MRLVMRASCHAYVLPVRGCLRIASPTCDGNADGGDADAKQEGEDKKDNEAKKFKRARHIRGKYINPETQQILTLHGTVCCTRFQHTCHSITGFLSATLEILDL